MPGRSVTELANLIHELRNTRREHEAAIKDIEETFRQVGMGHLIEGAAPRKRGPKAKAAKAEASKPAGGKVKRGRKGKRRAAAAATKVKGKPGPKPKKAGRRKRAKYAETADEFILSFLSKKGSATTAEIRQHWQKQGRGGKAENSLTGLVKSGKVTRTARPGQAGSSYSLPGSAPSSTPST